ncbi:DMT family transporter [Burkholderia cepacia]|uniref:DMT family transporter n=1 Tax=Burkholderia cepacia TaxID=292 RepID=UPI002AB626CE|nr:DMT family transporter [Burkholderia cepacia]
MPTNASYRSGVVAAVLAALCWGSATVMSKGALSRFAPVSLLVIQLTASVTVLWGMVWLRRPPTVSWKDVARFGGLGLLEPGLAYLLGLTGLASTEASGATLIQASESVMIVVASAILFRERPTGRFVVLSLIALCGLLLALGAVTSDATTDGIAGTLLIFAGTASAAIYVVLSGKYATKIDPTYIVAWQQTVALIFAIVMLPVEWSLQPASQILPVGAGVWVLACVSGIVQYALAFSLYMTALKSVSANTAGSFLNLVPLIGLAGAFVFLREELSTIQLIGAAVTIVAVTLISLSKQEVAAD